MTNFSSTFVQVLMLEYWKRQESRLAMRWGMSDFEAVSTRAVPSLFHQHFNVLGWLLLVGVRLD